MEIEEGLPEDLEVNAVGTTKCASCGRPGHEARSCLTSSKLVNIQPFKAEAAKPETQKDIKKCTFCGKTGHVQMGCWTFGKVIKQFNESQASSQGGTGPAPTPSSQRGNNRGGRGGRGNGGRGRRRGRGANTRGVHQVTADSEAGGSSPRDPPVTDPGQGN